MAGEIKHYWNGTILTITSDSGVSACDLKGEKGDKGSRGIPGLPGDCDMVAAIATAEAAATRAENAATRAEHNIIKPQLDGDSIYAKDSVVEPLVSLNIYGKSRQDGTPTATSPVEIVAAENPILTIGGGNYAIWNATEGAGITSIDENGAITFDNKSGTAAVDVKAKVFLPAGAYTLTQRIDIEGTDVNNLLTISREGSSETTTINAKNPTATFTVDAAGYYILAKSIVAGNRTIVRLQLEQGSRSTEYIAPVAAQTMNLPYTLHGMRISSHEGNYTDATGQKWACDEIDFVRGKYIKRIDYITGDKFVWNTNSQRWQGTVANASEKALASKQYYECMCNVAVYKATGAQNTVRTGNQKNANMMLLYVPQDYDMTNVKVYYQCAEVETDLTAEELAAYAALHSNQPRTAFYTDKETYIKATYIADTKAFITEGKQTSYVPKDETGGSESTVDLSNYYTKSETDEQITIALMPYVKATEIPSFDGMATTEYVDEAIAAVAGVDMTDYYTKSQTDAAINAAKPDLSGYYTKTQTDAAIKAAKPDLTPYALKTELPSVAGLASETYVNSAIAAIPPTDLSNYYTKAQTNTAINNAKPDLTPYATKANSETWTFTLKDGTTITKKVVLA